jgi:hypothetical protein
MGKKLQNEKLHNLYSSPNIIRMIKSRRNEMGRVCSTNGSEENAYRILVGKPERKRPLRRARRRWVNNVKIYLKNIGWDGIDLIDLVQERDHWKALVNTVMNLRVP